MKTMIQMTILKYQSVFYPTTIEEFPPQTLKSLFI